MSDMQANVTISLKDEISSRLGTIGRAVETLGTKFTAFRRSAGNVFTSLGSSASALSTASASLTTAGSRAAAAAASFRSLNASAGSIRTLSSSLAALPRALRDMASQMPSVVRHGNTIVRSLQGFNRDLPHFLRSSRSIRDVLGAVANKLRNAANQANLLRGSVSTLDGAVSSSNSQLSTLRSTLSGVESSLSSSATSAASLSASLGTIQSAAAASRAEAQSLSDAFENLGGLSISLGKGFLVAGGGIAGAGLYAVKKAMEVETSEATLRNTLTGGEAESAQQLQALYREAQKLGVELPGSTKDMMEMFVALRQQGISVKNILGNGEGGLGKATATFATLCGRDFQTSAVYVAKFQEALGVSAAKTTEMIGKLNQLRNASGLTEDQLFETMKYVGPSLSALKITGPGKEKAIDEIFSFFGILAKKGIEGSSAGTGTAQMLMRLSKINEIINSDKFKYADLIAKKNIRFDLFNKRGEFIGLTNAVEQFAALKYKLNDQQLMNLTNALLGDEAGRVMMAAMQEGGSGMYNQYREIQAQKGMDESIKNIMGTGAMKWETLQGGIETSISTIGKKISEHIKLNELFDKAIDKLDKLNEWLNDPKNDKKIKQWIEDAKQLAITLAGIGTTLIGIGSVLTSMVAVTKTIGAVGESFGAIKKAFDIGGKLRWATHLFKLFTIPMTGWFPLLLSGSGLIYLATLGVLIYANWKPLTTFFDGFFQGVKKSLGILNPSFEKLKDALQPVIDGFKELFGLIGTSDYDATLDGEALGIASVETFRDLIDLTTGAVDLLTSALKAAGKAAGTTFSIIADGAPMSEAEFTDKDNPFTNALKMAFSADSQQDKYLSWMPLYKGSQTAFEFLATAYYDSWENAFKGLSKRLPGWCKDLIKGVSSWWQQTCNDLHTHFNEAVNKVQNAFSGLVSWFKKTGHRLALILEDAFTIPVPGWWSKLTGNAPSQTSYAEAMSPQLASSASTNIGPVYNADQVAKFRGKGNSATRKTTTVTNNNNITVSVNGSKDPEETAQSVASALSSLEMDGLGFGYA